MATVTGSSVSCHRDPKRLWLDLPLIACGECKQKIVKEYRVKREGINKGRIFCKCPDREVGYYFPHLINMVNLYRFCLMICLNSLFFVLIAVGGHRWM